MDSYDVIIVGSGIGGLCCGSLLSLTGKKVLICEAHNKPGGVAHNFTKNGYTFESGQKDNFYDHANSYIV